MRPKALTMKALVFLVFLVAALAFFGGAEAGLATVDATITPAEPDVEDDIHLFAAIQWEGNVTETWLDYHVTVVNAEGLDAGDTVYTYLVQGSNVMDYTVEAPEPLLAGVLPFGDYQYTVTLGHLEDGEFVASNFSDTLNFTVYKDGAAFPGPGGNDTGGIGGWGLGDFCMIPAGLTGAFALMSSRFRGFLSTTFRRFLPVFLVMGVLVAFVLVAIPMDVEADDNPNGTPLGELESENYDPCEPHPEEPLRVQAYNRAKCFISRFRTGFTTLGLTMGSLGLWRVMSPDSFRKVLGTVKFWNFVVVLVAVGLVMLAFSSTVTMNVEAATPPAWPPPELPDATNVTDLGFAYTYAPVGDKTGTNPGPNFTWNASEDAWISANAIRVDNPELNTHNVTHMVLYLSHLTGTTNGSWVNLNFRSGMAVYNDTGEEVTSMVNAGTGMAYTFTPKVAPGASFWVELWIFPEDLDNDTYTGHWTMVLTGNPVGEGLDSGGFTFDPDGQDSDLGPIGPGLPPFDPPPLPTRPTGTPVLWWLEPFTHNATYYTPNWTVTSENWTHTSDPEADEYFPEFFTWQLWDNWTYWFGVSGNDPGVWAVPNFWTYKVKDLDGNVVQLYEYDLTGEDYVPGRIIQTFEEGANPYWLIPPEWSDYNPDASVVDPEFGEYVVRQDNPGILNLSGLEAGLYRVEVIGTYYDNETGTTWASADMNMYPMFIQVHHAEASGVENANPASSDPWDLLWSDVNEWADRNSNMAGLALSAVFGMASLILLATRKKKGG